MTTRETLSFSHLRSRAALDTLYAYCLTLVAFAVLTFGQPAYFADLAPIAALMGYALFFLQTKDLAPRMRFWCGFSFFSCIQAVQLWWFTSHPFHYIWAVYFTLCALMGLQFGLLTLFASRKTLSTPLGCFFLAGLWTLLEWSRLFWFSGFYFNLAGLYLTAQTVTLQMASLIGTLGLSFWTILTNCFVAYAWIHRPQRKAAILALAIAITPFLFGAIQLNHLLDRQEAYDEENPPLHTVIVHSKKVPDEMLVSLPKTTSPLERAFERWQEILYALAPLRGEKYDFILLPEVIVPFSSTSLVYPKSLLDAIFLDLFNTPLTTTSDDYVCSEDISRALTGIFGSPLIVGLEGTQASSYDPKQKFFNSAFCFTGENYPSLRYDKQILVPMGEYIPFSWAKAIAMKYGIFDSFTPGTTSKVFCLGPHRISPSICYEETFPSIMRKSGALGVTAFVNLTDDYWFPDSKLGIQHFEHARARTVENGTPLLRSCNYGISGAIDSLGRTAIAKEASPSMNAFIATVSSFHYKTLYSIIGDAPLLILSFALCLFFLAKKPKSYYLK